MAEFLRISVGWAQFSPFLCSCMRKLLQFVAFFGVGIGILGLVFRNQNIAYEAQCRLDGIPTDQCNLLHKLWQDFLGVHLGWLLAVFVAFTISNVLRALRWQMLIAPLGYNVRFHNSFLTILLGYFSNLGLPRMGEVIRAGTLSRYERIPLLKVMGTMVADRLLDTLCLLGFIALAFILEGDTLLAFIQAKSGGQSGGRNSWLWIVLLLGLMGCILVYIFRARLSSLPFFKKLGQMAIGFWEGLRTAAHVRNPALMIVYSVGIWVMFYVQCLFNLWAFSPTAHLGLQPALMVFVLGTVGFVIPSPGGMGTFHALCVAALALYSVSGADAFSYANIAFFAVQIFYNVVAGILSLTLLPVLNQRKPPVEGVTSM